jgi:sugar phosphate isomerase/epimerase
MLSLSTSWNSARHKSGSGIIAEIRALGFESVELNFRLTRPVVEEIAELAGSGVVKVSSLHNMCPLPDGIPPAEASPDYYSLSSPDAAERRLAVSAAKVTVDYAAKLGAEAVVLHTGRIPVKDHTRRLASLIGDEGRFSALRDRMRAERDAHKGGCLESVIMSLSELVPYAEGSGVRLGVENRYYYSEIPVMEEMESLFGRFKKGLLYYWHDVGHAEVFERLGLIRHKDLLERFSDRLIGVHLHDIIGPVTDHAAPGQGTFDFSIVKPYLKSGTIKVLEVHEPATSEDIIKGVACLKKALGKAL